MRTALKTFAIVATLGASAFTYSVANAASLVILGPPDLQRELDVNNTKPNIATFNPGPNTSSILSQIDNFIDTGSTDRTLNNETLSIFNSSSNGQTVAWRLTAWRVWRRLPSSSPISVPKPVSST